MTIPVDAGGQQGYGVDHAATLADLHRQRVGSDERERAGLVQGPVAERLDLLIEIRRPSARPGTSTTR